MVATGTYQWIDAAQAEEFDAFIAGRMSGSGLLIAFGLLIYRFVRKKRLQKKLKHPLLEVDARGIGLLASRSIELRIQGFEGIPQKRGNLR